MSKYNLTEIFNESFDSLAKKLDKQKGIDKDEAAKIAGSIAAKKMKGAGSGPTAKQKARMKEEDVDESFDSLAKKLDKQKGIDKEDAAKIAGSIAAKKMAGAGKGPTAKQKARVKEEEVSDTEQVFDIIYAAGGKDKATDFMDAIGEEFGIDFEYGRVNEQSKPINELAPDVRNRIEGLINRRFKYDFLMDFIKIYSDITQDDPFDSEDILEYIEEIMRRKLKEQDMYMDNFNPDPDGMKESIKEDEEEEEEVVKYEPFVEGKTILLRSEIYKERNDFGFLLENQEQYDYLIENGAFAFEKKYTEKFGIDEPIKERRYGLEEEFSLGNDMNSYSLTPIQENIQEDLFSKDGDTEDNVDNIDTVASPSTKGVGYDQVSKANTAEDDMESKETLNPKPMYEDLKKHFKRFM